MSNPGPTEASPLLSAPDNHSDHIAATSYLGTGIVPEEDVANTEDVEEGADLERQISNGDTTAKTQGLPEVRRRMKYIFPAIAVGVCSPTSSLPSSIIQSR